jgi:hypothetical protein
MSRPILCCVALLVAFAAPRMASAQDAATLEQRLRQLERLQRVVEASVARAESANREMVDTIRVGSLVLIGRPADASLIGQAGVIGWAKLDSLYGNAATLITTAMLIFPQGRPIQGDKLLGKSFMHVRGPTELTPTSVALQVIRAGGAILGERSDSVLRNWLGPQLLNVGPSPIQFSRVYIEMVTTPSVAVRRCFDGSSAACQAALGLAGDLVTVWYDASERRSLVQNLQDVHLIGLRQQANGCLRAGNDSSCIAFLRAVGTPPPLSAASRQSLLRVALDAGGRDGFGRLIQSAGMPLHVRISRAAALPIDSVVGRWRGAILAARPHPVTLVPTMAWTALAWCVAFGLVALRSTRWR